MKTPGFKFEITRVDDQGVEEQVLTGEGWALVVSKCELVEKTGKMRDTITLTREEL